MATAHRRRGTAEARRDRLRPSRREVRSGRSARAIIIRSSGSGLGRRRRPPTHHRFPAQSQCFGVAFVPNTAAGQLRSHTGFPRGLPPGAGDDDPRHLHRPRRHGKGGRRRSSTPGTSLPSGANSWDALPAPVTREFPYAHAPRLPEGDVIDLAQLFTPALPLRPEESLELEIGPGRGWFIFERLEAAPAVRMLGLEIRRKWATIVDDRLRTRGFASRARVFAEDARLALPRFPDASLSVVYVHFPDPWWKKRHQKRLVLGAGLLDQLARVLIPEGKLLIQTDVEERAAAYEALVSAHPAFAPATGTTPRIDDHAYVARSPRERRAMEDGLPIHRLHYRRLSRSSSALPASGEAP